MITELNEEQTKGLAIVRDEWIKIGLSTEPANRKLVEEGLHEAYKTAGLPPPKEILWVNDPKEGVDLITKKMEKLKMTKEEITDTLYGVCYGQHDAGWLSYFEYYARYLPEVTGPELVSGMIKVARNGGWVWTLAGLAVCVERPKEVCLFKPPGSDVGVLHNLNGPAFTWRSGRGLYFIRGISVSQDLIEKPLTVAIINKQENAEVRRALIEKYGASKYLVDSGAKQVHQDLRGTLFSAPNGDDEPITMVRYVNRTPEAGMHECNYCHKKTKNKIKFSATIEREGSFCKCGAFVLVKTSSGQDNVYKVYWHRVPPDTTTATGAFEWMYKLMGIDYTIAAES